MNRRQAIRIIWKVFMSLGIGFVLWALLRLIGCHGNALPFGIVAALFSLTIAFDSDLPDHLWTKTNWAIGILRIATIAYVVTLVFMVAFHRGGLLHLQGREAQCRDIG